MEETSAKRQAELADGRLDNLEATGAGEATEELLDVDTDEAGEVENVLEDELEIVDAGHDGPGERPDGRAPEGSEASEQDSPPQPFHSTRADHPGPRGCWALAKHGESCAAPAMRGHSYCAAHSGKGVSGNPSLYSPIGQAAHRRQQAVRATIRAKYGANRSVGPRAVLRAHVNRQAERLVGTAVNAALSPSTDPLKAGHLALKLISEADPPVQASVTLSKNLGDIAPEDVDALSYSELIALAQHVGIPIPEELPTPRTAP